jgi:hypothetical protein
MKQVACLPEICQDCQQGRYCPGNIERAAANVAILNGWTARLLAKLLALID